MEMGHEGKEERKSWGQKGRCKDRKERGMKGSSKNGRKVWVGSN